MLTGTFRQLNAEFGFSLQVSAPPPLEAFQQELERVQESHLQYLGVGNVFRLAQPEFAQRLARTLALRLRTVLDSAANALDLWSKSATAQLDVQLRERKQSFVRRRTAVDRIQEAAGGLVARLEELEENRQMLAGVADHFSALTGELLSAAGVSTSAGAAPQMEALAKTG